MVDKNFFERVWAGIVSLSRRVGEGAARLTNWQFVLLSLLALMAAAVLEDILSTRSGSHSSPVTVTINSSGSNDADADPAEPPQPPATPGDDSAKKQILKEIQKEIEKEFASDESPSASSKKPKKSFSVHVNGKEERDKPPFAPIIFFLIIILLAVRITTRSRLRADERVMSAEASAEMELLRRQVTEAQLQTLQAQVEPHFLFNTLAAVEHLTETDPPRSTVMLQHLIAFLRGSLPNMREQNTTLGREVDLCKSYLAIMQIRMEDRLTVSVDLPESLRGLPFPPMMLQSLVENAIKHGLEPKPEGGAVALSARLQDGRLRVTVADTGLGIAADAPQGVGLSNIRDRLLRIYGSSAALILAPNAPTGAHITIEIPNVPATPSDTRR
jgi:hypothetical protein